MSVEALSYVLRQSIGGGGTRKLVLIGLANHVGSEDWTGARPSVERLSRYADCSRRSVQLHLRALEADGWIEKTGVHHVEGRRDRAVNVYRIVPERGATSAPRGGERGEAERTNGAKPVTPEPSITTVQGSTATPQNPSRVDGRAKRPKVAGKLVTAAELGLANQIVAAFNVTAGSAFTVDAHLVPIVGRIREHPDLAADDHARIIRVNFLRPWWKDRPTPKVIYGNAAAFEAALARAQGSNRGRRTTGEQVDEAALLARGADYYDQLRRRGEETA